MSDTEARAAARKANREGGGEVRQSERMNLNPEPLKVLKVPVCRKCKVRAPWCRCIDGPDYDEPDVDG